MESNHPPNSESGAHRARVLVVDDDRSTRLLFTHALECAGFDVAVASDGAVALNLLRHASFDILLLDSIMPGLSGREVLTRLRADLPHRALPVIFVTGESAAARRAGAILDGPDDYLTKPVDVEELDIARGLAAGGDDYIVKPFSPRVLMTRVQSVLSRAWRDI